MGQVGGPKRIFEIMIAIVNHGAMRSLLAAIGCVLCALCAPLRAATVSTAQDLTAVIALQGRTCGKVVTYKKLSENEFIARCSSGDVYRVYVDAKGRVRVEKEK